MGSVYPRPDSPFWWLKWRDAAGHRKQKATKFRRDDPTGRGHAEAALAGIERKVSQERKAAGGKMALTLATFAERWLSGLEARGVKTAFQYRQRVTDYIAPALGGFELSALTDDEVTEFVTRTLPKTGLAPRTQHHIYMALGQLLRAARSKRLTTADTANVPRAERPKKRDRDPMWRALSVFSREEVEIIISSPLLAEHHRALWALLFLAGLRIGEALDLRWERYDTRTPILGRLLVATSYDTRTDTERSTKTDNPRTVPVHPALARILAAWKLGGWERFAGRAPKPGDLIIPNADGAHWSATSSLLRFHEDLVRLGLRKRRQHDARRTFISLALADGAPREHLRWITHGPEGDVMSSYTTLPWDTLCGAVQRLKIDVRDGQLVALPAVSGLRSGYGPNSSLDSTMGGEGLEDSNPGHSGRLVTRPPLGSQRDAPPNVSESPSERSPAATEADPGGYLGLAARSGLTVKRGGRS